MNTKLEDVETAPHDEHCECDRCGSERARDAEADRHWKEAR